MSRVCCVCEKGKMYGNNVSHSNRKARTSWNANVHKVRFKKDGKVTTGYVCTRCLRSGKIERVI